MQIIRNSLFPGYLPVYNKRYNENTSWESSSLKQRELSASPTEIVRPLQNSEFNKQVENLVTFCEPAEDSSSE